MQRNAVRLAVPCRKRNSQPAVFRAFRGYISAVPHGETERIERSGSEKGPGKVIKGNNSSGQTGSAANIPEKTERR